MNLTKKECFNNAPLRFEDFRVGMWVYDSKPEVEEFTFFKIERILSKESCQYLYHDENKKIFFDSMISSAREFEENRYYRVEVLKDE